MWVSLTAGTTYALIFRPVTDRIQGQYRYLVNGDGLGDLLRHDPATGGYFVAMNNALGTGFYDPATGVWYQALNHTPGAFEYTSGVWSLNLTIIARSPVH